MLERQERTWTEKSDACNEEAAQDSNGRNMQNVRETLDGTPTMSISGDRSYRSI